MEIRKIQLNHLNNLNFKRKEVKPYLEAEGAVDTTGLVKPLPPKGHLVKDNLGNSVKYFFKDIGYDLKAVKDGFTGKANDHQLGRLNDVGLKLGGIGIATYLASKTTDPKARIMEYVGLITFLTAMTLFPKLAINTPARIKHGFDIDKEYIDDQGRKKSVFQDPNYVPYEMYTSSNVEYTKEDLDKIGDKLGIPKDIVNRHDVIKEQMRKIATQNNTLWMLTAGPATTALTALACYGLENYVVVPALEKRRNENINKQIGELLAKVKDMTKPAESNKLSKDIEKILTSYKLQELPEDEIENIIKLITKDLDEIAAKGIRKDITKLIKTSAGNGAESYYLNTEIVEKFINNIKNSEKIGFSGPNREKVMKALLPTHEEIADIVKKFSNEKELAKGITISKNNEAKLREELTKLFNEKVKNLKVPDSAKQLLEDLPTIFTEEIIGNFETKKSSLLTEEAIKKIVNFSKIIGEFKENLLLADKCKSVKFEYSPETMLARASAKLEKLVLKELNISFKEMKLMRESADYTKEILEERINAICQNESRYKEVIGKIGKAISDFEITLNGSEAQTSHIKDLINAIEYNFNNTAKRLADLDKSSFGTTISNLIKEDVATCDISIKTKEDLFKLLDGLIYNYRKGDDPLKYAQEHSRGVGSSKNLYINRILSRYQGNKNIYHRLLHTFEIFKRTQNTADFAAIASVKKSDYINELIQAARNTVLKATSKDYMLKLNTINNPTFFKDIMNAMFKIEGGVNILEKGFVTDVAKKVLGEKKDLKTGNVLERYQYYLSRFKNLIANDYTDFTKTEHIIDGNKRSMYASSTRTNRALYDLIAQSPVDLLKGAAKNQYGTQKWLRIVGGIAGSVVGVTLLAQLGFGKLRNPQNLQKQVTNDTNK